MFEILNSPKDNYFKGNSKGKHIFEVSPDNYFEIPDLNQEFSDLNQEKILNSRGKKFQKEEINEILRDSIGYHGNDVN